MLLRGKIGSGLADGVDLKSKPAGAEALVTTLLCLGGFPSDERVSGWNCISEGFWYLSSALANFVLA